MTLDQIAIVGAGSWGCALANAMIRAGRAVTLYARDPTTIEAIRKTRRCPRLPDVIVDEHVALAVLDHAFVPGNAVLLVVPAQTMREVAGRMRRPYSGRHAGDRLLEGNRARHLRFHD